MYSKSQFSIILITLILVLGDRSNAETPTVEGFAVWETAVEPKEGFQRTEIFANTIIRDLPLGRPFDPDAEEESAKLYRSTSSLVKINSIVSVGLKDRQVITDSPRGGVGDYRVYTFQELVFKLDANAKARLKKLPKDAVIAWMLEGGMLQEDLVTDVFVDETLCFRREWKSREEFGRLVEIMSRRGLPIEEGVVESWSPMKGKELYSSEWVKKGVFRSPVQVNVSSKYEEYFQREPVVIDLLVSNVGTEIELTADNCSVVGNRIAGGSSQAILIGATCDKTLVTSNNCVGAAAAVTDGGTNTTAANNTT